MRERIACTLWWEYNRPAMIKRIVTIGGGTGTPVVNEALLLAGAKYISSIVTTMDSGGITGRRRTDSRGQEVAFSDALRTLLSLVCQDDKKSPRFHALEKILRSRTETDQLGYSIFSHLFDKKFGFAVLQKELENLTGIKFCGQIIPVTTTPSNISFETKSGAVFSGEHELDNHRMSKDVVKRIWLEPKVAAFPKALEAIKTADLIIFSLGSLHGSVLSNLLPTGVKEAYRKSKAIKVYVTNLASSRNETHEFQPADFISAFKKYSGLPHPLDVLVVPELTRRQFEEKYPRAHRNYDDEHSHFLGWEKETIKPTSGVRLLTHQATVVDPVHQRLRHDPKLLAKTFRKLLLTKSLKKS